jgi:hypothetical protein
MLRRKPRYPGVWVAGRSAEVKEEPAGEDRRAGDTQQSTLPPRLLSDNYKTCF